MILAGPDPLPKPSASHSERECTEVHFSTRLQAHQVFTSARMGEVDFTQALHSWRLFTSPWREANLLEPREMADYPVHAQSKTGAGATPPFDAPCITGAVGSLPPRVRDARAAVGTAHYKSQEAQAGS
jgi:hypothetical protein